MNAISAFFSGVQIETPKSSTSRTQQAETSENPFPQAEVGRTAVIDGIAGKASVSLVPRLMDVLA